jgi:hypothetical protein
MISVDGRRMFVVGDPGALYKEVRRKVGFKKVLDYLPLSLKRRKERHAESAPISIRVGHIFPGRHRRQDLYSPDR